MSASSRVGRAQGWTVALALAVMVTLLPATTAAAHADAGVEAEFVAAINRERAAQGLGTLAIAGDLTTVARRHSGVMADATDLHHNPDLGSDVTGWRKVGENVGRGPRAATIHDAFMDSAGHRRNILDAEWTEVGVGVVVRDGRIWVTEVFRVPAKAPEPKQDPAPEPTEDAAPEAPTNEPVPAAATTVPPTATTPATTGAPAAAEPSAPATSAASPTQVPTAPDTTSTTAYHDVVDRPLALDRLTLTLARQEAAERSLDLEDVLA